MLFLYNLAIVLLSPVFLGYFLLRLCLRGRGAPALGQRLGFPPELPDAAGGRLWLHAVSVGEVGVAALLIPALLEKKPDLKIVLSTVTQTGRAAAEKIAGVEGRIYLPLDFAWPVRSALRRIRPSMIALIETEIWPNLVGEAARRDIPVSIVNGRLSERSHRGYRRFRFFFSSVLGSVRSVLARGAEDAERFRDLGAASVQVLGNMKFDAPLPERDARPPGWYGLCACGGVIVAGSTHPGEDALMGEVAASIGRAMPGVGLLLAPRHLERVPRAEKALRDAGVSPVRWSSVKDADARHRVVILDVMGELADAYACASVAVIGGSFVPHGGQNPIEAARWAVPCLFGPHMENFLEVAGDLVDAGGARQLGGREDLEAALMKWLEDPQSRRRAGEAARRMVRNNQGATDRAASHILEVLAGADGEPG